MLTITSTIIPFSSRFSNKYVGGGLNISGVNTYKVFAIRKRYCHNSCCQIQRFGIQQSPKSWYSEMVENYLNMKYGSLRTTKLGQLTSINIQVLTPKLSLTQHCDEHSISKRAVLSTYNDLIRNENADLHSKLVFLIA